MRWKVVILIFIASIAITVIYMSAHASIDEIVLAIQSANPYFLILAILSIFFSFIFFSYRWIKLIKEVGANKSINLKFSMSMCSLGLLCGTFVPSRLGYYVKVPMLKKLDNVPYREGIAAVNVETILDFIFMLIAIPMSLSLISIIAFNMMNYAYILISALVLISAIFVWRLNVILSFIYQKVSFSSYKRANYMRKLLSSVLMKLMLLLDSTRDLISRKDVMKKLFILTVLTQLSSAIALFALTLAVGSRFSFTYVFSVMMISYTIGIISMIPGGLGSGDLSMILMFERGGMGFPEATGVAFFWRTIIYGISLVSVLSFSMSSKVNLSSIIYELLSKKNLKEEI